MPHFGLMDESALTPAAAALLRARLHWRGGKRRILQNKKKAGVATLWDAVLSAGRYYHLTELARQDAKPCNSSTETEPFDDLAVIRRLADEGKLGDIASFKLLEKMCDKSIMGSKISDDPVEALAIAEIILTSLGILPFDESSLPPEDPATY